MATVETPEKRGPIEKGEKGWPINPFGVVALIIFALIAIFLIVRPLLKQQTTTTITNVPANSSGGRIINPEAGQIIRGQNLTVELSVDEPQNVQKVQFWTKTYADGKWQMIGEVSQSPYKLDFKIPPDFENKSIAITAHIYQKDGAVIQDPGGWKEGIIILSQ